MAEINVLVIDDNVDDLELIERNLKRSEEHDFLVHLETNPRRGIPRVNQYDCVIIDYQFPTITGLELLKAIKLEDPALPVIVLTGQVEESLAVELIKIGANDYISKHDLATYSIDVAIAKAISVKASADDSLSKDHKHINLLVVDDNQDDIELIVRLLESYRMLYNIFTSLGNDDIDRIINDNDVNCVLLDYSMPRQSGVERLQSISSKYPFVAVIMMSGQGNERVAVQSIKSGADNYLVKNTLNVDFLHDTIQQSVDKKNLSKHLREKELDLIERESELKDTNSFLNLVFSTLPNYVFIKDADFRIVKANDKFLSLYPESQRDHVIGYTTLEAYDKDEADAFLKMDKLAFAVGRSETLENIRFPDGRTRTLHTVKTRFSNWKNENFILGVANDVTEREVLISKLEKSNEDLEQFAYVASHDLKSPVTAISKIIGWLEEDYSQDLPDEAQEFVRLIKGRANRMARLLDDLLQYSRVQRALQDTQLLDVFDIEKELCELTNADRPFTFSISGVHAQLPKVAIQIVFLNLLNNAIKHHDGDSVRVQVKVAETSTHYLIDFEDDGPGIAPQYARKIFEMFQTLRPRDEVEGSGMGLAMVRKVLDFYGGSIALIEKETRGAVFKIEWPKYIEGGESIC